MIDFAPSESKQRQILALRGWRASGTDCFWALLHGFGWEPAATRRLRPRLETAGVPRASSADSKLRPARRLRTNDASGMGWSLCIPAYGGGDGRRGQEGAPGIWRLDPLPAQTRLLPGNPDRGRADPQGRAL